MVLALAGVAVATGLFARAGSVGSGFGATAPDYREAVVALHRPLTLDPLLGRGDPASRDLTGLLYRGLLKLDRAASPVADLATSWGVTGDGLVYHFPFPPGLRWSDGSTLTAQDVLATVALVQSPGFPDAGLAAAWKGIAVAVDPAGAVTMTLPGPRASFAATVADLPVIPRAVATRPLGELAASAAAPLPSSGAYRVRDSDERRVLIEINPFSSERPALRVLEMILEPSFEKAANDLADGRVDALAAVSPGERTLLAGLPGIHVQDTVTYRFVDLLLNARRPGLGDVAVRRALASAIDRGRLIDSALQAAARPQVNAEPVGIAWLGQQPQEQPQPELAARALDAAGWTAASPGAVRARGGQRLSFTLRVPDAQPLPQVAAEVARQLRAIGVAVTVEPVDPATVASSVLTPSAFDMALIDWDSGPDPDLTSFWRSNATPPSGFNVSGTGVDLFLDRALDDLATENDPQLRIAAAQRVEQRLADNAPAVFLYAPVTSLATRSSLAGVVVPAVGTPADRYDLIVGWHRG